MNLAKLLCTAIVASAIALAGCDGARTSDYPDRTPETTRKVDDIKRNARDQKDAIDRVYDQSSDNLDFRERQIREKHKADRESLAIETDKNTADLAAKRREIEIEAKYEKERIDAELAKRLKSGPAEESTQAQAEAVSKKAEIDSSTSGKLTPILADMERNDAAAREKLLKVDIDEAKEISALEKERSQAREKMRTKKLEVDRWTTDELAKVDTDAAAARK